MNCPHCSFAIDPNARFCPHCGQQMFIPAGPAPTRFVRPREGRMVAGVCAGIAMRYGWDVSLVRLVLVLCVVCGGSGFLFYLIAWIVMPNADYALPTSTGPVVS